MHSLIKIPFGVFNVLLYAVNKKFTKGVYRKTHFRGFQSYLVLVIRRFCHSVSWERTVSVSLVGL